MNKLTAEVARRHQRDLKSFQENPNIGLSLKEELYLQALEIALPILEQQERGEGEWIEWGGEIDPCAEPVIGVVEVKFKGGETDSGCASKWYWKHDDCDSDIIAYRIIPKQPTNQNGEQ
ncbi:hypothetical protein [Pantoea agglomerans]|uniref:hypothetical protein n=1 Tax=Enterobacter agglomerans TaxID=549 RepID=UPI002448ACB2|nr:hypothetical protein [Pantoea agglomerans]MDH1171422.1 hypothetical protein [Pantoea agglomerans]